MNEQELRYRFPRASKSFLEANLNRLRPAQPQPAPRASLGDTVERTTQGTGRITLRYRIYRVRLLDEENLCHLGSTKSITDCLVEAGLLPGDDPKTVKIEVSQERVAHYSHERTVIEIIYP